MSKVWDSKNLSSSCRRLICFTRVTELNRLWGFIFKRGICEYGQILERKFRKHGGNYGDLWWDRSLLTDNTDRFNDLGKQNKLERSQGPQKLNWELETLSKQEAKDKEIWKPLAENCRNYLISIPAPGWLACPQLFVLWFQLASLSTGCQVLGWRVPWSCQLLVLGWERKPLAKDRCSSPWNGREEDFT